MQCICLVPTAPVPPDVKVCYSCATAAVRVITASVFLLLQAILLSEHTGNTLGKLWPVLNVVFIATKSLEGFHSYAYNWVPTIQNLRAALFEISTSNKMPAVLKAQEVTTLLNKRVKFMTDLSTGGAAGIEGMSKSHCRCLRLRIIYTLVPRSTLRRSKRKYVCYQDMPELFFIIIGGFLCLLERRLVKHS
jgi:hypothetical protein